MGIGFLSLSSVLMLSILISIKDRLASECGVSCGFLSANLSFNFLDSLLVRFSSLFGKIGGVRLHLNDLLVVFILGYIYSCAFFGVVKLGFGNLMNKGYMLTIKKRRAFPQALTIAAGVMVLITFSWFRQMPLFVPSYFSFVH